MAKGPMKGEQWVNMFQSDSPAAQLSKKQKWQCSASHIVGMSEKMMSKPAGEKLLLLILEMGELFACLLFNLWMDGLLFFLFMTTLFTFRDSAWMLRKVLDLLKITGNLEIKEAL